MNSTKKSEHQNAYGILKVLFKLSFEVGFELEYQPVFHLCLNFKLGQGHLDGQVWTVKSGPIKIFQKFTLHFFLVFLS